MINARTKDIILGTVPAGLLQYLLPRIAADKSPFLPAICERKAIFIHIPKAAGSSIKLEIYGSAVGGHRRIVEFAAYDVKKTRNFFKFCFVRNPWDRFLSAFSYLKQGDGTTFRDNQFAGAYLSDTPDVSSFAEKLEDPKLRQAVLLYDHFRPQSHWICIPGARTHMMDFVGRFETMPQDMAQLRARFGLQAGPVPLQRPSQHLPYREVFTDRAHEIVGNIYAEDIALLGYTF